MNPTIAQILVQGHHHDLAAEAARVHLADTARAATRSSSTGTVAGTRRLIAGLASSLVAVVR
ncbi:MAG TPA: hypothetical protein VIK13_07455 [Candidatus Limnocylindrales bacterium]